MEITRRYRVGVSQSVKGVLSFDSTVELTAASEVDELGAEHIRNTILIESDALVKELLIRYPPVEDKGEKK